MSSYLATYDPTSPGTSISAIINNLATTQAAMTERLLQQPCLFTDGMKEVIGKVDGYMRDAAIRAANQANGGHKT